MSKPKNTEHFMKTMLWWDNGTFDENVGQMAAGLNFVWYGSNKQSKLFSSLYANKTTGSILYYQQIKKIYPKNM